MNTFLAFTALVAIAWICAWLYGRSQYQKGRSDERLAQSKVTGSFDRHAAEILAQGATDEETEKSLQNGNF